MSHAMGELDAAGDLISGALWARTVDSHHGMPGDGERGGGRCLNCATALVGPHCHRCGQDAHVHRSLSGIGHEILHGVVHFEGRLWRTLPMLIWRPGELTRRYIDGERARFVSPMALFLFSVFTMFAVFSIVGVTPPVNIHTNAQLHEGVTEMIADAEAQRATAVEKRDASAAGSAERARYAERATRADAQLAELKQAAAALGDDGEADIETGSKWIDKAIHKWNVNPGLMLYKLQANGYKFSWLLIPLSLPFVWLLFAWRRQFRLYDHMVFVTYSIAFMTLLFLSLAIAATLGIPEGGIVLVGGAVPVVHIYRQLRGAYGLKRRSAIARTIVMQAFIVIILCLFLLALLALGALG